MENKSKWDKEYATSFFDEVVFLKSKGIRYTWVYTNDEGISVWKFKKEKYICDFNNSCSGYIKFNLACLLFKVFN